MKFEHVKERLLGSSGMISKTRFPLSRGVGAWGTATMGGGELGVWSAWGLCEGGEDEPSGASVVVGGGKGKVIEGFGSAPGAEEAPTLAARAAFIAFAKTILLEASITDPTFRQTKKQKLRLKQLYQIHKRADE